jgi:protein-disulfide isomerase
MTGAITRAAAAVSFMAALIVFGPALGQEQSKPAQLDPAQETAIRALVRDYLLTHPEVIIDAIRVYQQQQRLAAEERKRDVLRLQQAAIFNHPDDPFIGNPDGDVVRVRLVMKEFPILGPDSQYAARAALASIQQGLYEPFHFALMNTRGNLNKDAVLAIAAEVGLDVTRLQRDMAAKDIDRMLHRNFELAEMLDINGTPAFIVGEEIIPGAIDMRTLQDKIAQVRSNSS